MSENTTTVSSDDLDQIESQTDWDHLRNLTDAEIEAAVDEDPDQMILNRDWFQEAQLIAPTSDKQRITIRLDEDILDFFKRQGSGYQTRINKVLRAYVLSRQMKAASFSDTPEREEE